MAGLLALIRVFPGRLLGVTLGVFGAGVALGVMFGSMGSRRTTGGHRQPEAANDRADFRTWSIGQLRNLAEQRNIQGYDSMSRSELVAALRVAA